MLERLDEEIKRRTRVARIFPNPDSCLSLTASVLWGTKGLDSGYDQPGFGRKQGRPPVVSRAQYDVESLHLFCTWTSAFERFSRLWRFGFPKALGNIDFWADRLPPPPPV